MVVRRLTIALALGLCPLVLASAGRGENRLARDGGSVAADGGDASADSGRTPARDSGASDASLGDGGPIFTFVKDQPDPTPLVTKDKWLFDLRYDKGDVILLGTHPLERTTSTPTPRAFGRFALELYEGPALIERVRFDFPLLGAESPKGAPDLTAKLVSRIGVVFPKTERGTRLELLDRATGKRYPLPWPVH
ncbi:MAG: hypothetical protein U0174_19060 [Polyangiaceae bacterium]